MPRYYTLNIDPATFAPTASEIDHLIQRRRELENKMACYERFYSADELTRYNQSFGQFWFSPDTMRGFGSKVVKIMHGESPADWNIFISSERSYNSTRRLYTVRQLQIGGAVVTLSPSYTTAQQAEKAAAAYLAGDSPFISANERE